ncbi:complement resistance protein TraT, partial [Pantoea dispersa]|uniref:complement resistance protein TraT n=1 Tax=Pantoea dispersa TaxID=59814 RepID=UPI0020136CFF
ADAMVEDVNFTMVTDLQISERSKTAVTTDNVAALRQGTSGIKCQQRVKSDPLTVTTNGLILIHLVYS